MSAHARRFAVGAVVLAVMIGAAWLVGGLMPGTCEPDVPAFVCRATFGTLGMLLFGAFVLATYGIGTAILGDA